MNGAYMKQLLSFLATQMGICITQHKADCCNALNSGLDTGTKVPEKKLLLPEPFRPTITGEQLHLHIWEWEREGMADLRRCAAD